MTLDNSADWVQWIGREQVYHERIEEGRVASLAACLDIEKPPRAGDELPAGWQWIFFNSWLPQCQLSQDGHPRRDLPGSFLPPIPLPRRMWAGGRLRYLSPVLVGSSVTRHSRIKSLTPKHGRSGAMCFVTVEHTYTSDETVRIIEEQDIVYREAVNVSATASGTSGASVASPQTGHADDGKFVPSSVLLFRYSALTGNGHRIHYDSDYARGVEGYLDLVVHGPLIATLLQNYARRCRPDKRLVAFEFRGQAPLFVNRPIELSYACVPESGKEATVSAIDPSGRVAMSAFCFFE